MSTIRRTHANKATTGGKQSKPKKPYPDFPLFPHATRRWAKKIRGKLHYFGPWRDPDGALQRYLDVKDDLHAGRTPRVTGDGLTLAELVNRFLTAKHRKLEAGEIKPSTFGENHRVGERLVREMGRRRLVSDIAADDFERFRAALASELGPLELAKRIGLARSVFKYGYEAGLLDRPMRFGSEFVRPSRREMRKLRRSKPKRLLDPKEILDVFDAGSVPIKAMTLLGINCGFGNFDCSELPQEVIDFEAGVVEWPRPKTGVDRRCPLWPETIKALRDAIEARPAPLDAEADGGLVFLTMFGRRWIRYRQHEGRRGAAIDSLGLEFRKRLKVVGVERKGVGFYALRHTFRTVADEVGDRPAIDRIMGHVDESMADRYRERIADARLKRITDYVHEWLYSEKR